MNIIFFLIGILVFLVNMEVFAMKGRYVNLSTNGQTFKSHNGLDEIKLDFHNNNFSIISGPSKTVFNLDQNLQERGEFFYISRSQALWVLRSPVESQKEKIVVEGIQPNSPVIIFFENSQEKYRINYQQLGFSKISEHVGVGDRPKNYHWREPLEVIVPDLGPTANAVAVTPKINIQEIETGNRVSLEVLTGRLIKGVSPLPHPNGHQASPMEKPKEDAKNK